MGGTPPEPRVGETPPGAAGPLSRVWRWLPAAAVLACAVVALRLYGVGARDTAAFALYVALALALPGLLWARALYGRAHALPEQVALGLSLGYAIEVLTYLPARALGLPLLVLAWPLGTYALFLAVPRLRGHWRRGPGARPAPLWWSWTLALVMIAVVALVAAGFYARQPLTWPALLSSSVDMPFHLALTGELRNHVPPTMPSVAGEPLAYHWFVYAHLAAAGRITGIEPAVVLFRLAVLPMLAAFVVLLGMVGRRLTGSRRVAAGAVAATVFVAAPGLYTGSVPGLLTWTPPYSWASPTQTFGALLFAPVMLLLLDLSGAGRRGRGWWALLTVMLVALAGAKATYLPLLAAGLLVVAVVEAVTRFRVPRRAAAVLGLTVACLAFAHVVLFGGARQGIVVDPLSMVRVTWRNLTGVSAAEPVAWPAALGATLLCLLGAAVAWCGALGLLCRPRLLARPPVVLALGMSAAGLGAALLLGHPSLSQGYFLQAVFPYLAMLACLGLAVAVRTARLRPALAVGAACAGVAAVVAIRAMLGVRVPLGPGVDAAVLYLPYAALLGLVVTAGMALRALRRSRSATFALLLCLVTAAGTPAAWTAQLALGAAKGPLPAAAHRRVGPDAPRGAVAAGRWLRANSHPDDLVATNAHCRWGFESPCDSRAFWASALSERRVLVEGWAYTATSLAGARPEEEAEHRPFWDQERLRANDAVFQRPSPEAARVLRERYGVRWLFVDETRLPAGVRLDAAATPRFRSGDHAVYELTGDDPAPLATPATPTPATSPSAAPTPATSATRNPTTHTPRDHRLTGGPATRASTK
ncbi:hypothetical protein HTZ77_34390 [Nonomuraea sp. SMC257]|uniref:Uncharacterized protein n=1 Tax=Nonomuraea montanisoli TaxID=2741721 RepID=A0A7Y6IDX5_9ACTN|nr:hypothetical protein [Nonomuraea montanisoli]NUW36463.1 hypothetical protein [Nonomuraea montanisoli]